jgi:hypothetical protein
MRVYADTTRRTARKSDAKCRCDGGPVREVGAPVTEPANTPVATSAAAGYLTGVMKAVVQIRYGPPEQVLRMQEIERPVLGAGDALVRVRATSVNTPDWITVTGVPYILRLAFG